MFVQVSKFLGVLAGHMPDTEGLLLLYAARDHLLPLLQPDATRPRVQCAILDLMAALCSLHDAGTRAEAVTVAVAAAVSTCVDAAAASPSLTFLQAREHAVDDVRPHALGLVAAVASTPLGCELIAASPSLLERTIMSLVSVVASFRSPDAAARHDSMRLALLVRAQFSLLACSSSRCCQPLACLPRGGASAVLVKARPSRGGIQ